MVAAYAQARGMVAVAVKAAMSDAWGGREAEALRGVIAGDLPVPQDEGVGTKQARQVANKVVNAIRQLQGVVAEGRAAWGKASGPERARRAEENVWKCMRSGVMWQWQQAGIMEEHRRTRIARAWRRHRAQYTEVEWESGEAHEKGERVMGGGEGEGDRGAAEGKTASGGAGQKANTEHRRG